MEKVKYNPRIVSSLILFITAISVFTIGFTYNDNIDSIEKLYLPSNVESIENTKHNHSKVLGKNEQKVEADLKLVKITNSNYVIFADLNKEVELAGFELDFNLVSSHTPQIECGSEFECLKPRFNENNYFVAGITPLESKLYGSNSIPLLTFSFESNESDLKVIINPESGIYTINSSENILNHKDLTYENSN